MKKLLLLTLAAGLSFGSFAQSAVRQNYAPTLNPGQSAPVSRTTTVYHDSLLMSHLTSSDSIKLYWVGSSSLLDSGLFAGTNVYGFSGFAERYDFTGADSAIQVLGVVGIFGGKVQATSTKTITARAWSVGSAVTARPTLTFSGFPGAAIDSVTDSVKYIGISDTSVILNAFYFHTPTAYLTSSFFVGFTINYNFAALDGDTLGLYTTQINQRAASNEYTITGGDTTVNDVCVTLDSAVWEDNWYNLGNFSTNYYMYPIVDTKNSLGVKGVTQNNFTFFGNYPNPAVNSTNIKFALAKGTDVTIIITDMSGRTINTINQPNLSAGEHIIPVETSTMASGEYLYVIHTSNGDGMASTLTVAR